MLAAGKTLPVGMMAGADCRDKFKVIDYRKVFGPETKRLPEMM